MSGRWRASSPPRPRSGWRSGELRAVHNRVAALGHRPMSGDRLGESWQGLASWAATATSALTADCERITAAPRRGGGHGADAADAAARKVVAELLGIATAPLPSCATSSSPPRPTRSPTWRRSTGIVSSWPRDSPGLRSSTPSRGRRPARPPAAGRRVRGVADAGGARRARRRRHRRLRELSSGQFSLELVDATFMVGDHANADELRGARTLSGGETFLASLALALALADATSELAATARRGSSRSSSTRASARSTRHARRRRLRDRGARHQRADGRHRHPHARARRADAGAVRGDQGRRVVDVERIDR